MPTANAAAHTDPTLIRMERPYGHRWDEERGVEQQFKCSRLAVVARRADGHRRTIALAVPGTGAAGAAVFEVLSLPEAVHAATGVPRGARVDEAVALRVARCFIAHRAALAPTGEWGAPGAEVATERETFLATAQDLRAIKARAEAKQ